MSSYRVVVLADSVSPAGKRLTTMEVTFPRMVLAEFNTHRTFSRNSASSRAIPVDKQIQRIVKRPFVPRYWGKNQSGMQAEAELDGEDRRTAATLWIAARDDAVHWASSLAHINAHKQLVNRVLEPFMWHTVIVTATEWSNFFALRANPAAQPEIRYAAEMMLQAYEDSRPTLVQEGEWHLPLIQPEERDGTFEFSEEARKISAARCARVSYLTHDGTRDLQADLKLYERLVNGGHMSPLEHVATPFTKDDLEIRARMAKVVTQAVVTEPIDLDKHAVHQLTEATEFNGNFRGWTQLRKRVLNEHDFGLVEGS